MKNTFERVSEWNKRVNKLPEKAGSKDYWLTIENQFKRIEEELIELYEAIQARDIKEVVDAGADLDVVVSGLNYLSGSDYTSIITAVLDNNDLKYTDNEGMANNWEIYNRDNGNDCSVVKSKEGFYSLHRTEDDKILKYGNFPKVDIDQFLPIVDNEHFLLVTDKSNMSENASKCLQSDETIQVLTLDDEPNEEHKEIFTRILKEHDEVILVVNNTQVVDVLKIGETNE